MFSRIIAVGLGWVDPDDALLDGLDTVEKMESPHFRNPSQRILKIRKSPAVRGS